MNNEAYTSYPNENEILLREGCKVFILKVQEDFKYTNPKIVFTNSEGVEQACLDQKITIIHLFNSEQIYEDNDEVDEAY